VFLFLGSTVFYIYGHDLDSAGSMSCALE